MKNNYLVQAWLVITLAVCFGALLAGVETGLKDTIDRNKLNETYSQIPNLVRLTEDGKTVYPTDKPEEYVSPDGKLAYKAVSADGRHVGWVIKAAGQGFADKIELLIGLDPKAERITGMYVLEQKETPALGSKITDDWFQKQFDGKSTTSLITVTKTDPKKDSNEIRAISGATVSSESVSKIVNNAVEEFRANLDKLKKKE